LNAKSASGALKARPGSENGRRGCVDLSGRTCEFSKRIGHDTQTPAARTTTLSDCFCRSYGADRKSVGAVIKICLLSAMTDLQELLLDAIRLAGLDPERAWHCATGYTGTAGRREDV